MRRLAPIAAFAVLLALPLWAQHGGGHAGGGGFGGHGGAMGGGGHALSGAHSAFSSSSPSAGTARGYAHSPSFSQPFAGRNFSNRNFSSRGFTTHDFPSRGGAGLRLRSYGFRNNCRGYGCWSYGYPWLYGYYDPYWWDDSGSYDNSYEQDLANANEMNQQNLNQQYLEQQRMLQQEQADGDRDLYARSDLRPGSQPQGTPILPATVLVFRDQHRQEIQNYAIVGQTLWNFAPQHTQKISLSDLDLPATEKANDDRGLTFKVPSSNEGQ